MSKNDVFVAVKTCQKFHSERGALLPTLFEGQKQFHSLENITFELTNNNKTVQKGNTAHMLWKIDELISFASQYFTLKIGDIIFTGTPAGVAVVKPDDVLEGFLEGNKLFSIQIK